MTLFYYERKTLNLSWSFLVGNQVDLFYSKNVSIKQVADNDINIKFKRLLISILLYYLYNNNWFGGQYEKIPFF